MVNQVKDTLTTARDLLRSKQESAANAARQRLRPAVRQSRGSAATTLPANPASPDSARGRVLAICRHGSGRRVRYRIGSARVAGASRAVEPVDPLSDLEPMAASYRRSVTTAVRRSPLRSEADSTSAPAPGEIRGLEWFLKARAAALLRLQLRRPRPRLRRLRKARITRLRQTAPYSPPPPRLGRLRARLPPGSPTQCDAAKNATNEQSRNRNTSRKKKRNSSPTSTGRTANPKKLRARRPGLSGQSSGRWSWPASRLWPRRRRPGILRSARHGYTAGSPCIPGSIPRW